MSLKDLFTGDAAKPEEKHIAEKHRCRYTNSHGERCAHRLIESSTGLCTIHQRQREEETQTRSQEHYEMLFEHAGLLQTREEIRPFLATLLRLIALNQIPKDKAALLAYTCSLTLQTLPLRSRTEDDDFSFFRDVLPKFAPAAPPTTPPAAPNDGANPPPTVPPQVE